MNDGRVNRMMRARRCSRFGPFSAIALLLFAGPGFVQEAALPADYGYLLIRVELSANERVDAIELAEIDTKHVINIRGNSFETAGVNAWMALVAVPRGRYSLSEYVPRFGITASEQQQLGRRFRWGPPRSASETFEIVPGVVNYVGDWTMRMELSRRAPPNPEIAFEKATLERYLAKFPEHAGRFDLYLSAIGQRAMSLSELAKN